MCLEINYGYSKTVPCPSENIYIIYASKLTITVTLFHLLVQQGEWA